MTSYGEIAIKVLSDRGGFDWWWSDVDGDIQQEIIDEINETIRKATVVVSHEMYED